MASLQLLRKRFKSIQSTADMASAMKTASSVKYARISRELNNIEAYSQACDDTLALFGSSVLKRHTRNISSTDCVVLLTNNRGFCGGFNGELLRFFNSQLTDELLQSRFIVFGQKGCAFCKAKGLEFESMPLKDIPSYADAEELTDKLFEMYASGEVNRVILIYQKFVNMMTQAPTAETILPHMHNAETAANQDLLFLPDRRTALQAPAMYCLTNSIYGILLGHCAGIQAATSIAMRSACDNAEKSLQKLDLQINRIRQAEVTNNVIETSSYLVEQ